MTSSSEFVSQGHPDRTCDSIASYILDRYLEHDPKTRFALEVQMKDQFCNLAGEVTSTWTPDDDMVAEMVRDAIRKVGYTPEYASKWPKNATLNADTVIVNDFVGQQSPNIAQGVDREGWGDQGCFMGMATNEREYGYMPMDKYFANKIGNYLYHASLRGEIKIGLDIKVLVSIKDSKTVEQVVVAAPMLPENERESTDAINTIVRKIISQHGVETEEIIINGTGSYVIHSTVGDAGVVGRKLAVDFYGLNCPIGGGTTWGKDGTKADVTLNLYARYRSLKTILERGGVFNTVYTKIGCCIGKSKCLLSQEDQDHKVFNEETIDIIPSETIKLFKLDGSVPNMFWSLCENGLFSYVDALALTK
jgi:S-adenosylmethionine synthetase